MATLRADDGSVLRTVSEQRSSDQLQVSGSYRFRPEVPLAGTAPGRYLIHIEARTTAGDRPTIGRDVQIRIR